MTLPPGFQATLFAGEPDVVQPIAFTFDERGRLWVVECLSYPNWTADKKGRDRVVIFEDRDGDGRFDAKTVFYDKGANVSGIEVGFGGVWLTATPYLLFIPDRDRDDKPDGPPQILLDGWDIKARHNVVNSLAWGPDGWLYGLHGILSTVNLGKPGTPADKRATMNCGVWRFHPTRQTVEVVAHGTTNPWGIDFDEYGQMFITNCVIHHLWHVVPGAHFERMFGQDLNPHCYGLLRSCADHLHWAGGHWTSSRGGIGAHDQAGGGHAHSGAMVYLGDNWPQKYRNGVFTCNIHGNRVNHDRLERSGSGYVAKHEPDVILANDPWFRGLVVKYGPDGGVFVADWCDTGECHNYVVADRTNGRIHKITFGKPEHKPVSLGRLSDRDLTKLHRHANEWHVRQARRLLQERAAAGSIDPAARDELRQMLATDKGIARLRAMWTLYATGNLDESALRQLTNDSQTIVRAWAVRLLVDTRSASEEIANRLALLARADDTAPVRLELASALQRLPVNQRWLLAEAMVTRADDAADPYLPLMVWYGVESLVPEHPSRAAALLEKARIPIVREYLARRLASMNGGAEIARLTRLLSKCEDAAIVRDVLRGLHEALAGARQAAPPDGWGAAYTKLSASADAGIRTRATELAVTFGDAKALETLKRLAADTATPAESRRQAIEVLLRRPSPDLLPLVFDVLNVPALRGTAIRGLAAFDDPAIPKRILEHFPKLSDSEKTDAVQTLASRPSYALELLAAVERGSLKRTDIPAVTARQLAAQKDRRVAEALARVWGSIRTESKDRAARMAKYRDILTPERLKSANLANGRLLFGKTCAACHKLFGVGGDLGPDITGAQRSNLDYVLENVLEPNAIVPGDYQMTVIETKAGRTITGIVKQETDRAVTIQTPNETIVMAKDDIETRSKSSVSMMPEGLFDALPTDDLRDLVGYLISATPPK
jgi:putative membrane-bound dehydrogenase-like protein